MERLTTGRRHLRAGSVTVTELIRKQPLPFDLPQPRQAEAGPVDDGSLDLLLEADGNAPSSHRRPPSRTAQLAKISMLAIGSLVLCGAIAFGSMITHERRDAAGNQPVARSAADISGEQALLPNLLNRAVPKAGIGGVPQLAGSPTNATGTIDNPGPPPPPQAAPPAVPPAAPRTDTPLTDTELVKTFYELIPSWPDRAFGLLDGGLLGTSLGEFVKAWSGVSDVQVLDVRQQGNNVLAVVRLRLPDGSFLRVQQLLEIANSTPRRIVGAQIISAARN